MTPTIHSLISSIPLALALANALVQGPNNCDVWAAVGAAVAVIFVLHDTIRRDKSTFHLVAVGAITVFIGCAGPGVLVNTHFHEIQARLTWHGWAALGLTFGLIGWPIGLAIYSIGPAISRKLKKVLGIYLDLDNQTHK